MTPFQLGVDGSASSEADQTTRYMCPSTGIDIKSGAATNLAPIKGTMGVPSDLLECGCLAATTSYKLNRLWSGQ